MADEKPIESEDAEVLRLRTGYLELSRDKNKEIAGLKYQIDILRLEKSPAMPSDEFIWEHTENVIKIAFGDDIPAGINLQQLKVCIYNALYIAYQHKMK